MCCFSGCAWVGCVCGVMGVLGNRGNNEREREKDKTYLILRRGAPIRQPRWICYVFLQSVRAECAEHDAGGAVEATNCPEGWHC